MTPRAWRIAAWGALLVGVYAIVVYVVVPDVVPALIRRRARLRARSELGAALQKLERLAREPLEPTPLPLPTSPEAFRRHERWGRDPEWTLVGERRDVVNEAAFLTERGDAVHATTEAARTMWPDRAEQFERCLRSLEHSVRDAFPTPIDENTDTRECGEKVNAAIREFAAEMRKLTQQ